VPNIGPVQARILSEHFGDAGSVFRAKKSILTKLEGIGEIRASSIKEFTKFSQAEDEIAFIQQYSIAPLFLTHPSYPKRLLHCYDPPTLLYYKGEADLNASHIVAVIGTRNKTDYGRQLTEQLIRDLASLNVLVVSGLALGIDTIAHKAALKNNLPTVGVLAHGLDKLYPAENTTLAKDIIKQGGGLLTEFRRKTKPDKHNFPTRNRVVAGICDAIVVVETDMKGGSMITAGLGNDYHKDVFAFPGRTTDNKSTGCNHLIRSNRAMLLTDGRQLMEAMGWSAPEKPLRRQPELFVSLNPDEKLILEVLKEKETAHIDELNVRSGLSGSVMAAAVLSLELQGIIQSLPGKMYRLN
jgi:DNA processing protein